MADELEKLKATKEIAMEKGPMYGVELIDSLRLRPGAAEGMRQQLPSRRDLDAIVLDHPRVVAGFEVLLRHFQRAAELFATIDALDHVEVVNDCNGDAHYQLTVPVEEYCELQAILACASHPKSEIETS